jgi:hypothetical protein
MSSSAPWPVPSWVGGGGAQAHVTDAIKIGTFFGGPAYKAETARNPIERVSPSRTPSLHRRLPPPTHAGQGGQEEAHQESREPPHQPG